MVKYAAIYAVCATAVYIVLYFMPDWDFVNKFLSGSSGTIAFMLLETVPPVMVFIRDHKAPPVWRQSMLFSLYACLFSFVAIAVLIVVVGAMENLTFIESVSALMERDITGKENVLIVVVIIAALIAWLMHAAIFHWLGKALAKEKV